MASKLNTEFNYRYQVIGCTPWEKIKTLKGFLEGRIRAAALEEVGNLKDQAKVSKLNGLNIRVADNSFIISMKIKTKDNNILNDIKGI